MFYPNAQPDRPRVSYLLPNFTKNKSVESGSSRDRPSRGGEQEFISTICLSALWTRICWSEDWQLHETCRILIQFSMFCTLCVFEEKSDETMFRLIRYQLMVKPRAVVRNQKKREHHRTFRTVSTYATGKRPPMSTSMAFSRTRYFQLFLQMFPNWNHMR